MIRIVRSQTSLLLLLSGIVYWSIFYGYLVLSFSGESLIFVLIFIPKVRLKLNNRNQFNNQLTIKDSLKFQYITIKIKKFILMQQLNDYLLNDLFSPLNLS